MRKGIKFFAVAILGLASVACASPEKMAKMADQVIVKCEPNALEVVAGEIDATVSVTYPEKYFHPKAILEVTPVIVYEGGEVAMKPFMYQGVKVKDNYKTVPSEGATVSERVHFNYVPGMEKSHLELRGVVRAKNGRFYDLPIKKVADGANTTYMLVGSMDKAGEVAYKADNYQPIIKQTAEGQILYTINSSSVRRKELKSDSIKDFQAALDQIKENERQTLVSTEVVAYASPDGGEKLNTKLSDRRSKSASKAWNKVTKNHEVSEPMVQSVGQDWEGFQSLVAQSNIEDKDLILRVLSMYSDPEVREREIKNISEVYTELKTSILPELRRARFIANVEFKNYTNKELVQLVKENIDILDEEALLHTATLLGKLSQKKEIYKTAINKFNSDRAQFNLGVVFLNENKLNKAEAAFNKVETKDADLDNALGVVALRKGETSKAAKLFEAAGNKKNMGILDILEGRYAKAEKELNGVGGSTEAIAHILNGNITAAEKAVGSCKCLKSSYVKAIIAARKGNAEDVQKNLERATKAPFFKERAAKDIEFADFK